jgi:tol-pal system protein YbgF
MMTRANNMLTAISMMAVMFFVYILGGCVLPRHIDELKAEIGEVKSQNEQTQNMVASLDSTVTAGTEANAKLRGDVSYTVDELQQQISTLLENYSELMSLLRQIANNRKILFSSPGTKTTQKQADPSVTTTTPVQMTAIDCGATYDEAFILVRRGEYETAIDSFNFFVKECPKHESVENAYYWIGESYYSLEKYHEAVSQFDLLINAYKSSPNIGRALYKLARSYQELGKKEDSKRVYKRLVDEFDGTLEAEQAKERLKELK